MTLTHLPEPKLFIPDAGEPALRWGIVGPGWIAGMFAEAVSRHTAQRVVAVGSRSQERADAFAAEHGIPAAVASVDALVSRPDVDVVYVATPPSDHMSVGLAAIAAGKHVLIEKPLATSAAEVRELTRAALAAGVLIMEAMWSRYLPQASVLRTLLADGAFGAIRSVMADHGQSIPTDPAHRLQRRDKGGGALLDIGVYAVQFASQALGAPRAVTAIGDLTAGGVDAYATLVLDHGAAQAVVTTSIVARTHTTASIAGTEGAVMFGAPFYNPTTFHFQPTDYLAAPLHWQDPTPLRGFDALSWQATAFAGYVGQSRVESPVHTHAELLSIFETMDAARAQLDAAAGFEEQAA